MTLARLANVAHCVSEAEVRQLLGPVCQTVIERDWNLHGVRALRRMIEFNENYGALTALLEHPEIDVNSRNNDGLAPLHVAVLKDRPVVVKHLLDRVDLDINSTADFDLTPILLAARLGHVRVLKLLLEDPRLFLQAKTVHDFTALHLVTEGDEETSGLHLGIRRGTAAQRSFAVRMVRTEQDKRGLLGFENCRDVFGRTALHYAARNGYVEMVKELLGSSYLNPNPVDNYGLTPLHLAVKGGHMGVVRLLVRAHNIDLNYQGAFRHVRSQVLAMDSARDLKLQRLYPSACDDDAAEAESCVTPLHIAAREGHLEILSVLLSYRSTNVNAVDSRGFTALDLGVVYGKKRVVELLMEQPSVELNYCMSGGRLQLAIKLLAVATQHGNLQNEIGSDLIDHIECLVKTSPERPDSTLLHWAAESGHVELSELILAWRPEDANATDKNKQTPLHLATFHVQTEVVRVLCCEKGWCLRAAEMDESGATPLDYAFENGEREIQKLLLRRADVKEHMGRIYNLEINTLNSMFIGATLFASVTFVGWLQPPLGFISNYDYPLPSPPAPAGTYAVYASTASIYSKLFFIFNTMSFILALVIIYNGIFNLVINRERLAVGYVPRTLRQSITYSFWYFVVSATFIFVAYISAGRAVLPPNIQIQYISLCMTIIWLMPILLSLVVSRKHIKRQFKGWWFRKKSTTKSLRGDDVELGLW